MTLEARHVFLTAGYFTGKGPLFPCLKRICCTEMVARAYQ